MLKYLIKSPSTQSSSINPPAKRKKNEDEKTQQAVEYEKTKRKRSFQPAWRDKRTWLLFANNKMYCTTCRGAYGNGGKDSKVKSPFLGGCDNFKKDVVTNHEISDIHIKSTEMKVAKENPTETPAFKMIVQLTKANMDKLTILFQNAHAIAKHCRPFKDFSWMVDLDRAKGLPGNQRYQNDKQCYVFVRSVFNTERSCIRDKLKNVKFLSILTDGSQDVSTIENECIYVRSCVQGNVEVSFIGMQQVARANAPGIFDALMKALTFEDTPSDISFKSKLIALGSDGASVNTGQKGGLIALLKRQISCEIIIIKCVAHGLELVFKSAAKSCKLYDKINTLLQELFSMYHKSALQKSNLETTYKALALPPLMPLRVGGTRWIGHYLRALEVVWKGYPAFVEHLKQVCKINLDFLNIVSETKKESALIYAVFHTKLFLQ